MLLVPVIGLVLYLALHSAVLGLANLQALRVENQLKQWQKGRVPERLEAFEPALRAANRALAMQSGNPHHYTLKARVLEWRGYRSGDQAEEQYRHALALHRRAAELRPLWPDTWAEMAVLKLRLGEFDADLDYYLAQADRLGPYTAVVHKAVVQAGFAKLQRDPFVQPPLLETHILRGMSDRRTRGAIARITKEHRQQIMVCRWLQLAEQPAPYKSFCEQKS